jgi:hypothetical protein
MGLIPNRLPGAVGLKRICEALHRDPLKKLFEKYDFLKKTIDNGCFLWYNYVTIEKDRQKLIINKNKD